MVIGGKGVNDIAGTLMNEKVPIPSEHWKRIGMEVRAPNYSDPCALRDRRPLHERTPEGRTAIPLKAWKAERVKLNAEKSALNIKYQSLKNEIREVEIIRRHAESIEWATIQPQKKHTKGIEAI
jgi:hypothetical protein